MNRNVRWLLLVALIVLQLGLPAVRVWKGEHTLSHGKPFRFAVEPVDPEDAFRGRYVALRVQSNLVAVPAGVEFNNGQRIYVRLTSGANGLAMMSEPQAERFESGDYLQVEAGYRTKDGIEIGLPYDRYYLDEDLAPEADARYRKLVPRRVVRPAGDDDDKIVGPDAGRVQLGIRVLEGYGVIEDLYYDGQPVRQYLKSTR